MSYKAVLFDMDGTLLDTLEDLRDSTNHVLRQMGYPERSLEEMRRFVGNGAEKQIRRAVPEGTSEEKIMEVLTAYRAYYQDHCQIKTRVYDGLLDMLNELKAKGIKLAVVSNKPDSAVQKLSREYFGDRMDFAVGPSDGVRCKPYPDMAETALKALGIAKKDAVFVGDSEVDVQTGLNAGLDVIAVSWGFRSREVVIEGGAKMIADMPVSAAAALFRIHMSRPVEAISTVMERASAMMSTTDIMSAAPLMNAFTKRLSDTPPMTPMMSAMSRNHVEASSKYQLPSGTPVRKLDQAGVTSSSATEVASTGAASVVVVPFASS